MWEQVHVQHDCDDAAGGCEMQVGEVGLGDALQGDGHGHYESPRVSSAVAQHCLPCRLGRFFRRQRFAVGMSHLSNHSSLFFNNNTFLDLEKYHNEGFRARLSGRMYIRVGIFLAASKPARESLYENDNKTLDTNNNSVVMVFQEYF